MGSKLKIIAGLILAAFLIVLSITLIPVISETVLKNADITKQTIETSVEKALIHCYAIEGAYPPTIEYLTDNYGIILQEERYFYYYEFIGSNIRPIVRVVEK
ncbi:MAG: hypothetical protein KAQ68_01270 [Clostridiales bacterium]|nr:hypothetical protein [Clostridiales bacterium]